MLSLLVPRVCPKVLFREEQGVTYGPQIEGPLRLTWGGGLREAGLSGVGMRDSLMVGDGFREAGYSGGGLRDSVLGGGGLQEAGYSAGGLR